MSWSSMKRPQSNRRFDETLSHDSLMSVSSHPGTRRSVHRCFSGKSLTLGFGLLREAVEEAPAHQTLKKEFDFVCESRVGVNMTSRRISKWLKHNRSEIWDVLQGVEVEDGR
jgi:hypothetical protein